MLKIAKRQRGNSLVDERLPRHAKEANQLGCELPPLHLTASLLP